MGLEWRNETRKSNVMPITEPGGSDWQTQKFITEEITKSKWVEAKYTYEHFSTFAIHT